MTDQDYPYATKARGHLVGIALVLALMWGWYFLEQHTDWRIGRHREGPISIWGPIIVSGSFPLVTLLYWRRELDIAKNAVAVTATVRMIGGCYKGFRDITIDYEFEGIHFLKRKSIPALKTMNLGPGSPLLVFVDTRNPKRILIK